MKHLSSLIWAIALLALLNAIFSSVLGQTRDCFLFGTASLLLSFCSVRLRTGSWSLF